MPGRFSLSSSVASERKTFHQHKDSGMTLTRSGALVMGGEQRGKNRNMEHEHSSAWRHSAQCDMNSPLSLEPAGTSESELVVVFLMRCPACSGSWRVVEWLQLEVHLVNIQPVKVSCYSSF
jgi:hypothetical protein